MIIAHIYVQVNADHLETFIAAITENARQSVQEPGILRFDVMQQADDPTKFVFVEIYEGDDAVAAHRDSAHFKAYREAAGDLIVAREVVRYNTIFPSEIKKNG